MMPDFHGTREAFTQALIDMAQTEDRIMFVSPDSLKAMRATEFAKRFPNQYIETGIAEQAAVDVAAGLAAAGEVPYVGTYAGFLTMRACEQMRTFVAYPNLNVKFVGINGGLLGGEREGVTHQFYEDLGLLSSMPTVADVNILYPQNTEKILELIESAKWIVTVEDHNINGGLGSYISRLVVENAPKYVKRIALETFGESGPAKELADAYGYDPKMIAKAVLNERRV